jgi:hypothetical protein
MQSIFYNINNLQNRKLFYMLDNIMDDSVKLFRRTPNGDEEFTSYDLHRMPDGKLLIAFHQYWAIQTLHSLVAICEGKEEFVNTQPFERICKYYKYGQNGLDPGGFIFMNSAIVPSFDDQWRCDAGLYGVELFTDPLGDSTVAVPDTADALIVYEPILAINGVAHLVYIERENKNNKTQLMNNSITPFATYSLSEALKLIIEWSQVSQEPFNNVEPIAIKAFQFTQQLGIPEILVRNQSDMQVAEFLKGNPDARKRPADVVTANEYLLNFVKQKMAHMSLANLLSCYPQYEQYDNVGSEIQRDIQSAENQFAEDLNNMRIEGSFSLDNYEDCLDLIPDNYVNGRNTYGFRWSILKQSKNLALSLVNK